MARDVRVFRVTDCDGNKKVRKNGFCAVSGKLYGITVDAEAFDKWNSLQPMSRGAAEAEVAALFPHLNKFEREFLMYDVTPDEMKAQQ